MRSMFRQLVSRVRPILRAGPVLAVLLAPVAVAPSAAADGAGAAGGRPVALAPNGTAEAVCADTPLRLTFDSAVRLGTEGRLTVRRADGGAVDTVDLADPATYQRLIGDARSDYGEPHRWNYEPVVVTGRTATVLLHRSLEPGQRYYVIVDPGFFLGHRGITAPHEWRFRTADAPRPGTRNLRVDARPLPVPGGPARRRPRVRRRAAGPGRASGAPAPRRTAGSPGTPRRDGRSTHRAHRAARRGEPRRPDRSLQPVCGSRCMHSRSQLCDGMGYGGPGQTAA
ncbi:Ig-like domain-containing protein [Streptomyces hyderabadensis]|uniref:Ig-like domain-containing protein n=1 Tax=Streptomyces hyderabadensis TaxID=598549 RepID=UPI001CF0C0C6|nr:Ig-like domain-containing protein [Streptomyces hyderabadensis]